MSRTSDSGRRSRRKARADCRSARHRYGSAQPVGGGILRRICLACGAVSIDLTALEPEVGASMDRRPLLADPEDE